MLLTACTRNTRLGHTLLWCLQKLSPRAAAFAYFRLGDLQTSLRLARQTGELDLQQKCAEMLTPPATPTASHIDKDLQFNNQVLHVCHSSISYDLNGYAVRTQQLLHSQRAIDITPHTMTRLGYPWDLQQHTKTAVQNQSRDGEFVFAHKHDPQRLISGPESIYVEHYAHWIVEQARQHDVSVIHAHSNYLNGLAAHQAAVELHLPYVYEMRGLWHLTRSIRETRYAQTDHYQHCQRAEIAAANAAQAVVVLSRQQAHWLQQQGIAEAKINVIGNAAVAPVTRQPPDNDTFTAGYVGSLVDYEGVDTLLQAVARCRQLGTPVNLIIAGDGNQRKACERLAGKLGLAGQVQFLGRVPNEQIIDVYRRLDVAVVPRRKNPLTVLIPPLKPMEIMAFGVPLVCSRLPPLQDLVEDSHNGVLVTAEDPDQLAQALLDLCHSPARRESMSAAGIAWSRSHSWQSNALRYQALYQHLFI